MLPLTLGMLIAGPTSGYPVRPLRRAPVRDRRDARLGARLRAARCLLPIDFSYRLFAAVLFLIGASMGLFASPNRAAVMNSLPPQDRGAGGGMNQTFQNSAQVLSVGIFFTLMILGLAANLPHALASGLQAHGVSAASAHSVSHVPPVSILFAAFLGYNPIEHLVGSHVLGSLPAHSHAVLTGRTFFPHLISGPFSSGLHEAFLFAIVACLIAAAASLARGGKYHHGDVAPPREQARRRKRCPRRPARRARRERIAGAVPTPIGSCVSRPERSSMRVEWFGQSAFRLDGGGKTVAIDPFGDMSALSGARGIQWDYPAIAGVEPDLLLVTHEHSDHNGVEAIDGEPRDAALDGGHPAVADRGGRRRSPPSTTTRQDRTRPEHDLRVRRSTACACVTWATSVSPACARSRRRRSARSTCCSCRSAAAHGRRRAGRGDRQAPYAALGRPMHYRTPRIGFLETAEEFLQNAERVVSLEAPVFETDELAPVSGPLVVVPAAP